MMESEMTNDMIDLGAASTETKGTGGPVGDAKIGQQLPGLSED
jgi:hypothetical protein